MKKYIRSFRLRTLPLSLSGVILGSCFAAHNLGLNVPVFILAIFTTLSLQILANLANELGDALKGTDLKNETRPQYGLQQGVISVREMECCIWVFVVLSAILGGLLLWLSFGTLSKAFFLFLLLGGFSIIAAITYTLGKKAYGYHGFGDLFVFVFFGLVSVIGSYYLQHHQFEWSLLMPASAIGLLIVSVLNINNIRDMTNDAASGKRTFVVLIGNRNAKIYQCCLILSAELLFCLSGLYEVLWFTPLFITHIYWLFKFSGKKLDPQLPLMSLITLVLAITSSILQLLF